MARELPRFGRRRADDTRGGRGIFGLITPLPNPERTGSSIEDCQHIAQAIIEYAEKMRRRVADLEGQIALTSRVAHERRCDEGGNLATVVPEPFSQIQV
jgi:hypothetical protein